VEGPGEYADQVLQRMRQDKIGNRPVSDPRTATRQGQPERPHRARRRA
jgi:hypothetical protein